MTLEELTQNISKAQQQKLSGGITCRKLTITDNGSGQLTLSGDVLITVKVIDLTTEGASQLHSLMSSTQSIISNKLKGDIFATGFQYLEYDAKKNKFNPKKIVTYSLRYNIHYLVNLEQINKLSQLAVNDFVLAVVDEISLHWNDRYHKTHNTGGLAMGESGPAIVSYKAWTKKPTIAVHEFFHTLGLDDLDDKNSNDRLMYNVGTRKGDRVTNAEKLDINRYLMHSLEKMSKGNYKLDSIDTKNKLRKFLNDPSNGFKYNKAKFN